jgi:cupin 2 domain-containing protein
MDDVTCGNLWEAAPASTASEVFEELHRSGKVRIERIVSTGQATPAGQWYDQEDDEWVVLLTGAAELLVEGETCPRSLRPGDWIFLPARCRHRVESTDLHEPTIWLAVHIASEP